MQMLTLPIVIPACSTRYERSKSSLEMIMAFVLENRLTVTGVIVINASFGSPE